MNHERLPELRKGERSSNTKETPQMVRRLYWLTAFISLVLYLGITLVIMFDKNPSAEQVRKTVYGDRPLGLPWQVVHAVAFAVLCAPFPVWLFSAVRISFLSAELGRPVSGVLDFVWQYRALTAVPEVRPYARRLAFISLAYFVLFIGWLVFTSIMGI
jgi:hypothetical protein